jgi:hypothetical protein
MHFYTKPNHEEVLKLWNAAGWEQRNRERAMGEIPEGTSPEIEEDPNSQAWRFRFKDSLGPVALGGGKQFGPWDTPEEAMDELHAEFGASDPADLCYVLAFGDPKDELFLDYEQFDRRQMFEKNCSCHIAPPCGNCIEHSDLFPETV